MLSCVGAGPGAGFSLGDLLGGEGAALRDPKREAALASASIPHTVVRAGEVPQPLACWGHSQHEMHISEDRVVCQIPKP